MLSVSGPVMSRPGMRDRDKYERPNPRRTHTIMSPEDVMSGKKSQWPELEITGSVRNLSPSLWKMTHLTCLYLNDNALTKLPADVCRLACLTHLDLSSNKLRSLPPEIGELVYLRELLLTGNHLRVLPYEMGKLFKLQVLGLKQNPLTQEFLVIYNEPGGTFKLLSYLLENLPRESACSSLPSWSPCARLPACLPTHTSLACHCRCVALMPAMMPLLLLS